MSKTALFGLIAVLLYAAANVFIDYRFAKHNSLVLMTIYAGVISLSSFIVLQFSKGGMQELTTLSGTEIILLLILGLIFFCADYFYISAYTAGGKIIIITCLAILLPVFASMLKVAGSRFLPGMEFHLPNWWTIGGYVFGITSVLFIMRGAAEKII